mmetsp:Transcript_20882/g.57755  ORF Transcript_20882/g.57755 Transcript_20882/m.57755 type:complete len:375 (+) Transcript_20882:211-1335(+)
MAGHFDEVAMVIVVAGQRLLFTWRRKGLAVGNQLTQEMITRLNGIGFVWQRPSSSGTTEEGRSDDVKIAPNENAANTGEEDSNDQHDNSPTANAAFALPASHVTERTLHRDGSRKASSATAAAFASESKATETTIAAAADATIPAVPLTSLVSHQPSGSAIQPNLLLPSSTALPFAITGPAPQAFAQAQREQSLIIQQQIYEQEQLQFLAVTQQRRREEVDRQMAMIEHQLQTNALHQRLEERALLQRQMERELQVLRHQQSALHPMVPTTTPVAGFLGTPNPLQPSASLVPSLQLSAQSALWPPLSSLPYLGSTAPLSLAPPPLSLATEDTTNPPPATNGNKKKGRKRRSSTSSDQGGKLPKVPKGDTDDHAA